MDKIFNAIFHFICRHRAMAIAVLTATVLLCALVASKIRLEENVFDLFPQDEGMKEVSALLGELELSNRLVFNLYFRDSTRTDPDSLVAFADAFAEPFRASSYVDSVAITIPDSQFEVLYDYYLQQLPFYLTEADYVEIEERISPDGIDKSLEKYYRSLLSPLGMVTKKTMAMDPLALASFPLQRAREFQIEENFGLYKNHLLTKDRQHLVFFLDLHFPPNQTDENRLLIAAIDGSVQNFETAHSSLSIEYFGAAAVAVANAVQVERDIYLTVGLALLILFTFISLFYRSISTFFLVLFPAVFGGLVATAALVYLRDSVSIISLATGSVLLGITIDFALHLLTHFKREGDVKRLFSGIAQPTIICALTTASTFFALLFMGSRAMQDLGIFAGISILAAALFALLALPHFALAFRQKHKKSQKENILEKLISSLAHYPFHRKKWTVGVFVALTIISLFTWRQYGMESEMLKLNFMPDKLAKHQEHLNAISSLLANTVYIASKGNSFKEALAANAQVDGRLDSLIAVGRISGYFSANALIPSPPLQAERLARWDDFWQAHSTDSTLSRIDRKASELGFQDGVFTQFENTLNGSYHDIPLKSAVGLLSIFGENLLLTHKDKTITLLTIIKTTDAEKSAVLEDLSSLSGALILDKAFLVTQLAALLAADFNLLVNLSLLFVFLILLISYGRIELALMAYLPILVSWLWVLGVMGLFGLSFNIVNIIICTFIFGLGIDYSIFSMRGMLEKNAHGSNNYTGYRTSIILSALTTLIGVGVLIFARHPALRSIALLAVIGILSVLFITFTLQPLLFRFMIGKRKEKARVPYTLASLNLSVLCFSYFLLGCVALLLARLVLALPFGKSGHRKDLFHLILMYFSRSQVYIMPNVKKVVVNRENANFNKPAIIIANHHSFVDILIILMFHPKVVLVTNDWVYHSPLFGSAVRFGDFIPASCGLENQTEKIKALIDRGYSIAVFPEGSRQRGFELGRFRKGAFYLAETFGLDIQPIILHGTNMAMPKGDEFCLRSATMTVKFLPRIPAKNPRFGNDYSARAKQISRYFKQEYSRLRVQLETPKLFRETLIKNFIYKSPILEWYAKIKIRSEEYYSIFDHLIPRKAIITDLGCGYGFMAYGLALSSTGRQINAIDYDDEKIKVAAGCPVKPEHLKFLHGDVAAIEYYDSDVFLISDVMHYLTRDEQDNVLKKMLEKLNKNGKIIIRDGDRSKTDRHKGTMLSEFFSTNIGFNKTRNALNYISADMIAKFAEANGMEMKVIDNTRRTSNLIFVLKKFE